MQLLAVLQLKNMTSSINLLDFNTKVKTKRTFRGQNILRIIAIGSLFIVSALSIIFFILVAISPIPQLRKQKEDASRTLSLAQTDIVKIALVNERSKAIKSFIDKRENFDEVINYLQSKITPDISIESILMKKDSLYISLTSTSLLSINNFINKVTNNTESLKFSQIVLKSLSRDEGKSIFLLTLSFKNS